MTINNANNRNEELKNAFATHKEKFTCTHPISELRKRTLKNKATSYVQQCLTCGKPTSRALSRNTAFKNNNGNEPQPFNEELKANWENSRNKDEENITGKDNNRRELLRTEFWKWYNDYLETPKWQKKRALILQRAGGGCEGCGVNSAEEVHHLTYRHKGDEFLFELVAVCRQCHDKLHAEDINKTIESLEQT